MQEDKSKGVAVRKEILEKIISYIKEHGYSPTVREIGEMCDLQSTSSVHHHLLVMFKERMLETDCKAGTPRAIRVPGYQFVKIEHKKKWEPCSIEIRDANEIYQRSTE